MDEYRAQVTNLILRVCHLCDRTRDLAESGKRGPAAVLPVQEAADLVRGTLETLYASLEADSITDFPAGASGQAPEENWLLADDDVLDSHVG